MKTFHHTTNTRERSSAPQPKTDRAKRRAELRKAHKVQLKGMEHDPHAVKFKTKRI